MTIYNLTKGQIFNPTVVAAHSRGVSIFTPGEEATLELAALAEDADGGGLVDKQEIAGAKVEVGSPAGPGEHASVDNKTSRRNYRNSVVGMLVITNDAFYGLNGVRAGDGSSTHYVPVYDAGSEENNEDCAFIPGPPCNNPHVRATDKAAGFVHIHSGIHGGTILIPARDDWRNPVAKIIVTRVKGRRSNRNDYDDDDD